MQVNNFAHNSPLNFDDIETVLWDWNGTLLDDLDINVEIINRMHSKRGRKPLELVS